MPTHQLTFSDCEVDDVAARALGIAQRAYEVMVKHAKPRVARGGPLAEKQAVQSMIVDS